MEHTGNDASTTPVPYQNYVHAEGKAVLCMSNFSGRDRLFRQPGRIFWSDLVAVCCSRVMAAHGGSMKGLEAIWRMMITNNVGQTFRLFNALLVDNLRQITQNLINVVHEDSSAPVDFVAGEDNFFAFLATDHGRGPLEC